MKVGWFEEKKLPMFWGWKIEWGETYMIKSVMDLRGDVFCVSDAEF
jgi:hypothetical protein